ncbi:hypothetical protein ACVWXN_006167 [Bradyrhizobium sp. i1.4.4]
MATRLASSVTATVSAASRRVLLAGKPSSPSIAIMADSGPV